MAEALKLVPEGGREENYELVLKQLPSILAGEPDLTANLANLAAVLKEAFDFFWVGFYRVQGDELVLGPFQGPLACTRIPKGRGVCGACWERAESILVPDVEKFPGHIACSSLSKSEVVVPVFAGSELKLILDVDSDKLDDFSELDLRKLEELAALLSDSLSFD